MKNDKEKLSSDKKNTPELVRYFGSGAATTFLHIFLYQVLLLFIDYKISNLIAIIASKIFAYAVNKHYVFRSECRNKKELFAEIARFIVTRGSTGLFDYFGLILAVESFGFDRVWSKYVIQAIVIVMNYILGKKAVFVNKDTNE